MRFCVAAALVLWLAPGAAAAEPQALAEARTFYNAGRYDAAIESAALARSDPEFTHAAALVLARAHLERYRLTEEAGDLATARETLGTIRSAVLSPRDQVDLLIGLGQTLYFSERFGAAAELFDDALARASLLDTPDRVRLLDWWASSLAREAPAREGDRRALVFARIAERMKEELRLQAGSAVANYWLAVAARGVGDLDLAWDAAVAGWVRAPLSAATTGILRADLDRFVREVLIAERARTRPDSEQQATADALGAEWERIKRDWQ